MADPTIREQVLRLLFGKLQTTGAKTVERNPDDLFSRDRMPALALFDGDAQRDDTFTGEERFLLSFDIELSVSAASRAQTTAAVDEWYGKVVAALVADISLGGLVSDVLITAVSAPEFLKEAEHPYAAVVISGETTFAHAPGDPYNLP